MGKNLNVLGFLNINTQKVFSLTTWDKVDSDVVIGHFDLFAKEITKPTTVVLDNASIHTSIKFKEKIKEWEAAGLSLFYLPPYSPQLNPIEQLWKFMKYYWIEFDAYKSARHMQDYVEKALIGYGSGFEINFG